MDDSSEVFDIDMDTLVKLKNKACSETNFAVQAVFENLFLDEEIESKNLSRAKGKESLDPVRIEKGKQYFFEIIIFTLAWRKKIETRNGQRPVKFLTV